MVGGGIVGLPYTLVQFGLTISLIIFVVISFQTTNSSWLYLKGKDFLPGQPESLFEIGYILLKRSSIFLVSGILFLTSLGMVMIYLIIFGGTMGSVVQDIWSIDPELPDASTWDKTVID